MSTKLTEYLASIADAIRLKTGRTGTINAQNFVDAILDIEVSSGEEGNGNLVERDLFDESLEMEEGKIYRYSQGRVGKPYINLGEDGGVVEIKYLVEMGWIHDYKEVDSLPEGSSVPNLEDGDFVIYYVLGGTEIYINFDNFSGQPNWKTFSEFLHWDGCDPNINYNFGIAPNIQKIQEDGVINAYYFLLEDSIILSTIDNDNKYKLIKKVGDDFVQSTMGFSIIDYLNATSLDLKEKDLYGITTLRDDAFSNWSVLSTVELPETVTQIGDRAFLGCYNLQWVKIKPTVQHIGDNCWDYSNITLYFDGDLKDWCTNALLKSYNASWSNFLFVGEEEGRSEIVIDESIPFIKPFAFCYWDSITNIQINNPNCEIGDGAFSYCDMTQKANLQCKNIPAELFSYCDNLNEVTIQGDSITEIGFAAFKYCINLPSIELPPNVESIQGHAFYDCYALTSINLTDKIQYIGEYAFYCCNNLQDIHLPAYLTTIEQYSFYGCGINGIVSIPTNVTNIKKYGFSYCSGVEQFILPPTYLTIEDYAFDKCDNLTSLVFTADVKKIGNYAFRNCSNLTRVDMSICTKPPASSSSNSIPKNTNLQIKVSPSAMSAFKNNSIWKSYTLVEEFTN